MTAQTPAILKTYFQTGNKPTQAQFGNLIDSPINQLVSAAQTIQSDVSALGTLDLPNGGMTMGNPVGGNKGVGTINVAGNIYVDGTAIGTPSGSGTVMSGTANQIAYYPTTTNSVSGTNALPSATTATTQAALDSSSKVATTNFVNGTALNLTNGTVATTQAALDNSTKVATTAYVDAISSSVKAWVTFAGGTGTISGSLNVSSVVRNSVGDYTINFTNALVDTKYAVSGATKGPFTGGAVIVDVQYGTKNVGSVEIITTSTASTSDATEVSVIITR